MEGGGVEEKARPKQTQGFYFLIRLNGQRCADIVHDINDINDINEDVDVHQADLNRLRGGVTPAVAEGEVGEVDVVAVHELGQTGSQKQKNLRVCEA